MTVLQFVVYIIGGGVVVAGLATMVPIIIDIIRGEP